MGYSDKIIQGGLSRMEAKSENEAERQDITRPKNVQNCPKNLKPLYKKGELRCSGKHRRTPKVCRFYNLETGECDK